jgi:8-oxo-dGTP diphosphatase
MRPIDVEGQRQADMLAGVLRLFEPARLLSAPALRCRQTLEPLAQSIRLPIVSDSAFAEPSAPDELPDRAKAAATRLAELRDGPTVAICSQGKLIPRLLAALSGGGAATYRTDKGAGWLLALDVDGALVALDPLD